ncbi:MAG: hypothetical protein CMF46_02480 [Legionellales bacterium]|nr:hypothetical protein [Legionellales bacterium]|tara:strand:+ start:2255 stop:2530 length:276 start_codon:yes stop_codon:yes gene_type:complete
MLSINRSDISNKTRLTAAALCWFLGWLGAHRFYVNRKVTGVLMALTLGGLGIWIVIDFILIVTGNFRDNNNKLVHEWQQNTHIIEDEDGSL